MDSPVQTQSQTPCSVRIIQQYPDRIVIWREEHRWNGAPAQSMRLWEHGLKELDDTTFCAVLQESLAHLNDIDAIAYDCTNTDVDAHWEITRKFLIQLCDRTTTAAVSVVLCLNPLDVSANAVETALRLDAVPHAVSGIRANIVYAPPSDCVTELPVVQYLLHPHSRYITGSAIDINGKILLGGMLNAERVLASRASGL
ncbi:MAG: hypothetical protein RLY87_2689 [Chloroflexota bacterium]